jgi:epoxide hydrolase-like predicted phosphatase
VTTDEPRRNGLLIDWGGVFTSDLFASFGAFCEAEGLQFDAVASAFRFDRRATAALVDFECGRIERPAFEQAFGAVMGIEESDGLVGRLFAHVQPDDAMLAGIAELRRAGVRTGLLSNSWGGESYDRSRFDELFDVLVISGDEGVRKPDPKIYETAAERIGLPAEQLVFVDDIPGNLKPARALGMHTVHHTNAEQTLQELRAVLLPVLR